MPPNAVPSPLIPERRIITVTLLVPYDGLSVRYGKCVSPDRHRIAILSFCVDNKIIDLEIPARWADLDLGLPFETRSFMASHLSWYLEFLVYHTFVWIVLQKSRLNYPNFA